MLYTLKLIVKSILLIALFFGFQLPATTVSGYGLNEQLYLDVTHPYDVAFTYKFRQARDFGDVMSYTVHGAPLVLVEPKHACVQEITNGYLLGGTVALIERGECSFVTKALNAEAYGARAVIITDHDPTSTVWIDMVQDGTNRSVQIPVYFMLGMNGKKIRDSIIANGAQWAVVNIPVNYTNKVIRRQPPWDTW